MAVYNILENSPYKTVYRDYTFVFSSERHLIKFNNEVDEYIKEQKSRYMWKLKVKDIENELVFILMLYKTIETRGFLVLNENKSQLSSNYGIKIILV